MDKVVVMEAGTVVGAGFAGEPAGQPHSRFHQLFAGQVNRQGAPDGMRANNNKGCPRAALVA